MAAERNIWEEHEVLYHYTSEKALRSILESQTLWATHYKFLNDPTEISQMKNALVATVTPEIKEVIRALQRKGLAGKRKTQMLGGLNAAAAAESEKIIEVLYRVTFGEGEERVSFAQPYIVSFCTHDKDRPYTQENGLLSQWRGYGRNSGCAIIFDCKKLTELVIDRENENYYALTTVGDVVYEGDDNKFRDEFSGLLKILQDLAARLFLGEKPGLEALYGDFINSTSRFKHQAFEEEREVRIICSPITKEFLEYLKRHDPKADVKSRPLKKIHRRQDAENKMLWVPYIKLFESIDDELLPIRKIIVGPGQDQPNVEMRTQELVVKIYGKSKVEIQRSKTPFRKRF